MMLLNSRTCSVAAVPLTLRAAVLIAVMVMPLLSGCGQKGPLYRVAPSAHSPSSSTFAPLESRP